MNVFLFCPDRHIVYEGATAEQTGVGGGITVRLRIAAALAGLGEDVTVACNCSCEHRYRGARFLPLDSIDAIDTDVLIVHTTGGAVDARGLAAMPVRARIRILLVDGVQQPLGSAEMKPDWVYACSNFIAKYIQDHWTLPGSALFVTHHGVQRPKPSLLRALRGRDRRRLIYTSHPSKGLDSAIAVTRKLRARDRRFTLHVYGGEALWGSPELTRPAEDGITYHGMVGQNELLERYSESGFAMHLQSREEPFGISLAEAMGAGCIVAASPVGAYPELVQNSVTGLLIAGDHESETTRDKAADAIERLSRGGREATEMRRRAAAYPLSWDTVASTWQGHWKWALGGQPNSELKHCPKCGGGFLRLADGNHCVQCGTYWRDAATNSPSSGRTTR
jgi:glycosyltransferase involved in cell wall biosynthesis